MDVRTDKTRMIVVLTLLGMTAGVVVAADLSPGDREFVNQAAQGNLWEVSAGKLAATRAQDPAIKSFGQMLAADHTAANEALKSVADAKQLTLPGAVGPAERANLGKLESLNGAEFDRTFADLMVKDHVTDIRAFEKEVQSGQDPDVKAFARQALPTLRHHLMTANGLASQQKKSSPR